MAFLKKHHLHHPIIRFIAWICVGLFATLAMDVWGVILHFMIHQPLPNYALLGRYFILLWQHGHIVMPPVAHLPTQPYENLLGWSVHIAIGLVDTFIYMTIIYNILKTKPHLFISLVIGWALIIMPLLIEQPMLGLGIAASHTPHPNIARLITFSYHTVFGLNLFLGSVIFHRVFVLMLHLKRGHHSPHKT